MAAMYWVHHHCDSQCYYLYWMAEMGERGGIELYTGFWIFRWGAKRPADCEGRMRYGVYTGGLRVGAVATLREAKALGVALARLCGDVA